MPHGIRLSPPTQPIRRRFRPLVYRHAHIASHGHMSTSPNFLHPSLVDNPLYYSIPMPCLCGAISITSYPSQAAKQSKAQPSPAQHSTLAAAAAAPSLPFSSSITNLPPSHFHTRTLPCLVAFSLLQSGPAMGVVQEEEAGTPPGAAMVVPRRPWWCPPLPALWPRCSSCPRTA